jgi:hypothetical protein
MYWFLITYYDIDMYVKPLTNKAGIQLEVYATNPTQASHIAENYMYTCGEYDHHVLNSRLESCVREQDVRQWYADHS